MHFKDIMVSKTNENFHHCVNTAVSLSRKFEKVIESGRETNSAKINFLRENFVVHKYLITVEQKNVLIILSPVLLRDFLSLDFYKIENDQTMKHLWTQSQYIGQECLSSEILENVAQINASFFKMIFKMPFGNFDVTEIGEFQNDFLKPKEIEDLVNQAKGMKYNFKNYLVLPLTDHKFNNSSDIKLTDELSTLMNAYQLNVQDWKQVHNPFSEIDYKKIIFTNSKSEENGIHFQGNYVVLEVFLDLENKLFAEIMKTISQLCYKTSSSNDPNNFLRWFFDSPVTKNLKNMKIGDIVMNDSLLDEIKSISSEKKEYVQFLVDFEAKLKLICAKNSDENNQYKKKQFLEKGFVLATKIPNLRYLCDHNFSDRTKLKFKENSEFHENLFECTLQANSLSLVPILILKPTEFESSMFRTSNIGLNLLVAFERAFIVCEFALLNDLNNIPFKHLYCALQNKSADKDFNYECFETIGDSVLKILVSLHLYSISSESEKELTDSKNRIIKNENLAKLGASLQINYFIRMIKTKSQFFIPPNFLISEDKIADFEKSKKVSKEKSKMNDSELYFLDKNESKVRNRLTLKHDVSESVMADVVEALIGAAFVRNFTLIQGLSVIRKFRILDSFNFSNYEKGLHSSILIDLKTLESTFKNHQKITFKSSNQKLFNFLKISAEICKKKKRNNVADNSFVSKSNMSTSFQSNRSFFNGKDKTAIKSFVDFDSKMNSIKSTQEREIITAIYEREFQKNHLNYIFENQYLFRQAINLKSGDFQRLEFFGDSVLEIYVVSNVFYTLRHFQKPISPEILTLAKSALVSCSQLCRFAYHLKLHKFLRNIQLQKKEKIIDFIEKYNKHKTFGSNFIQKSVKDSTLEDCFEAILGAVFLDGFWPAVHLFLDRFMLPYFIYFAKFNEKMIIDLKSDIINYFQTKNQQVKFEIKPKDLFFNFICSVSNMNSDKEKEEIFYKHTSSEKECLTEVGMMKVFLKIQENENRFR